MGLFVYRCEICGRTDERFRRAEDRAKEFDCNVVGHKIYDGISGKLRTEDNNKCFGKMKFQSIQRTHWKYEKYDGS